MFLPRLIKCTNCWLVWLKTIRGLGRKKLIIILIEYSCDSTCLIVWCTCQRKEAMNWLVSKELPDEYQPKSNLQRMLWQMATSWCAHRSFLGDIFESIKFDEYDFPDDVSLKNALLARCLILLFWHVAHFRQVYLNQNNFINMTFPTWRMLWLGRCWLPVWPVALPLCPPCSL